MDESGFEEDMPRLRGYAKKGQRCYDTKDWHARKRTNAIGAIVDFSLINVCLFETNINSDIFFAWLTLQLLPELKVGSVIVLDNATFHKRKDMIQAIEDKEKILEYLPTYSPDLNPNERNLAQSKSIR